MSYGLSFRDTAFVAGANLSALNSDWITRILAAGGARPNANTLYANDAFYAALVAAGITGKVKIVNLFAPDNLIAAITPLFFGAFGGGNSWANNGPFVAGDLTVNGLKGDGTKYLQTSWTPGAVGYFTDSTAHMSIYVSVGDNTHADSELGALNPGGVGPRMYYQFSDNVTYANFYTALSSATISASPLAGYLCFSRTTSTRFDAYFANSTSPHASKFNSVALEAAAALTSVMPVFANNANGIIDSMSHKRLSAVTFGTGLTSAESLALYNAIQAFRTAIGGGFV